MLLKMMDDDQDQETQNQAVDLAKKDENIEFWIHQMGINIPGITVLE